MKDTILRKLMQTDISFGEMEESQADEEDDDENE